MACTAAGSNRGEWSLKGLELATSGGEDKRPRIRGEGNAIFAAVAKARFKANAALDVFQI